MVSINPTRFDIGGEELLEIIEMAEMAGKELIKVVSIKPRSAFKVGMFDALAKPIVRGARESYTNEPIEVRAPMQMYQDSSGFCYGLCLNTKRNWRQLIEFMKFNKVKPVGDAILKQITEYAINNDLNIKPVKSVNQFVNRTVTEKRLEKQVENKDFEIEKLKLQLAKAEEDKLVLEDKAQKAEALKVNRQNETATAPDVKINDDGEPEVTTQKAEVISAKAPVKKTGRPAGRSVKK